MQSKELGFNMEKVLIASGPRNLSDSTALNSLSSFKLELLSYNGINSLSYSNIIPGKWPHSYMGIRQNLDERNTAVGVFPVDHDFVDVYQMKMLAGRDFDKSYGTDNRAIIVSGAVSKKLGFKHPHEAIDKQVHMMLRPQPFKIIGVVIDFHQLSLENDYTPVGMILNTRATNYVSINMEMNDVRNTINKISELWEKRFPNAPFNYYFLDDLYNQQYDRFKRFNNIIKFFTIVTIIISFIGLWAISSRSIAFRTKEIGIRKVLNATSLNIALLLFRYYFILIIIACAIGTPIAYYVFKDWLSNYSFRITLGLWFYILPILFISIILTKVNDLQ